MSDFAEAAMIEADILIGMLSVEAVKASSGKSFDLDALLEQAKIYMMIRQEEKAERMGSKRDPSIAEHVLRTSLEE